jgi:SAM-dependent methyltransferase
MRSNVTSWVFKKLNQGPNTIPRRLKFAKQNKILKSKELLTWLDLGAGNGTYLKFMSNDSYGLDIVPNIKRKIFKYNFLKSVPIKYRETADVIWCSALIEHVLRPHEFLIDIKKFLKPEGVLVIIAPNTLRFNPFVWSGTYAADHVNFFNQNTLRLTLQYAGYQVLFKGSPSFGKYGGRFGFISPNTMIIAKPIVNFQYSDKAHKIITKGGKIKFKDVNLGH